MIKSDRHNIYIHTENGVVTVSKADYSNPINCDEMLQALSFKELCEVFKCMLGIPGNIKDILLKKIKLYDSSDEVNSFIFKGNKYWLSKDQRNCMLNLCTASKKDDVLEIVLGDQIVVLPVIVITDFLHNLELYAYKCYVNTQKHLALVNKLTELEAIINYDYTTGYPDKLNIE